MCNCLMRTCSHEDRLAHTVHKVTEEQLPRFLTSAPCQKLFRGGGSVTPGRRAAAAPDGDPVH